MALVTELLGAVGEELGILGGSLLVLLSLAALLGEVRALVLEDTGGDKALDLGGLGVGLRAAEEKKLI